MGKPKGAKKGGGDDFQVGEQKKVLQAMHAAPRRRPVDVHAGYVVATTDMAPSTRLWSSRIPSPTSSGPPPSRNQRRRHSAIPLPRHAAMHARRSERAKRQRWQVLLPLVNVPMLEYSIEFLAGGGVEVVHVVARSHVSPTP
jgi:hypothetical protein